MISGGYTISTKHFKIYDDKEAFLKHITQLNVDSNNIEIRNNCKTAAMKCFSYFQPFQMLSRYAEQVYEYISGQDKNLLNEDILQTWKDKIIKVTNEGLDDIEDSIKLIFKNLREDVTTQIKPEFNKFLLQVNTYRQYLISNIFTISSSEVAAVSDNLSTSMSTFIDLVPSEIFL